MQLINFEHQFLQHNIIYGICSLLKWIIIKMREMKYSFISSHILNFTITQKENGINNI